MAVKPNKRDLFNSSLFIFFILMLVYFFSARVGTFGIYFLIAVFVSCVSGAVIAVSGRLFSDSVGPDENEERSSDKKGSK